MVLVKNCCFGCTLGDGTIGAGLIGIVEGVLYMAFGVWILSHRKTNPFYLDFYRDNLCLVTGICFIVQGLMLIFCCCLLFKGVKLQRRSLIFPWLTVHGITVATSIFIAVAMCVSSLKVSELVIALIIRTLVTCRGGFLMWLGISCPRSGHLFTYSEKAAAFLAIAMTLYLHIIVLSFYQSLKIRRINKSQILVPPRDILGPYEFPYQDEDVEKELDGSTLGNGPNSFPHSRMASFFYLPQLPDSTCTVQPKSITRLTNNDSTN